MLKLQQVIVQAQLTSVPMPASLLSRMDIPTNRYSIRFIESSMFDEMWFRTKFLELGNYSIHCIQLGEKDVDTFIPVTRDSCDELN